MVLSRNSYRNTIGQWSVDILIFRQVYDEESMLKRLLGLKGCHIQTDAKIRTIPRLFKKLEPFIAG